MSKRIKMNALAKSRKGLQPAVGTLEELMRAGEIPAGYVIKPHSNLEDAAVQLPDRPALSPPGCFQHLMGFKILAGIKQFQPFFNLAGQAAQAFTGQLIGIGKEIMLVHGSLDYKRWTSGGQERLFNHWNL